MRFPALKSSILSPILMSLITFLTVSAAQAQNRCADVVRADQTVSQKNGERQVIQNQMAEFVLELNGQKDVGFKGQEDKSARDRNGKNGFHRLFGPTNFRAVRYFGATEHDYDYNILRVSFEKAPKYANWKIQGGSVLSPASHQALLNDSGTSRNKKAIVLDFDSTRETKSGRTVRYTAAVIVNGQVGTLALYVHQEPGSLRWRNTDISMRFLPEDKNEAGESTK